MTAAGAGRPVLVTGGAGFIGANLTRRWAESGRPVRVLDDLSIGRADRLPAGVELAVGDIRDADAVSAALAGVDRVVHLAAAGSVVASVDDPWTNFEVNVRGSLTVLDAARRAGVHRVVLASTGGAIVGEAPPPVDEGTVPRPLSPYGASKAAVEAYGHAFAGAYGLGSVMLRFANVYGPHSEDKTGAVTTFFRDLSAGRPLRVHGTGASRDFMYVDDIVAAIAAALDADLPGGTVMHVATGVETPVDELARLCAEVAGKPGHPIERDAPRAGEVRRNAARFDRAQALIGFRPTVALRAGLERTWAWHQQRAADQPAAASQGPSTLCRPAGEG